MGIIAFIIELISGNFLEFVGGAAGLIGLVAGSMFTGSRAKRKMAEQRAEMLEREIEVRKEHRHVSDAALIERISDPD